MIPSDSDLDVMFPVSNKGASLMRTRDRDNMAELRNLLSEHLDPTVFQSRFPRQPPTGSVLRWERKMGNSSQTFVFVGLRIDERWYLTGNTDKLRVMDWHDLQEEIGDYPCALVIEYFEVPQLEKDPIDEIANPREWAATVFAAHSKDDQKD